MFVSGIAALGHELVDLGLSNVTTLLYLIQLMLHRPELRHVEVGWFLLGGGESERERGRGYKNR